MSEADKPGINLRTSYAAISIAMLLPVLIWPLQTIIDDSHNPGLDMRYIWFIAASALLLCAVTTDSILAYQPNTLWPFFTTAWIFLISMAISTALRVSFGAYILACLFAIHVIRSAIRLWRDDKSWWLWTAWGRDSAASLGLFTWICFLPMEQN